MSDDIPFTRKPPLALGQAQTLAEGSDPGFESLSPNTSPPVGGGNIAGRYEILGLLGSGGMGNVYKVRDTALDETIALKTLHRAMAQDAQALARFRREVKLARRVTHPNVARTYDLGTDDELPYITMEFIDGAPLHHYVYHHGPLTLRQSLDLIEHVAQGLSAAHDAEVIHRDLKPANIMVCPDGRAVITDFGIARAAARQDMAHQTAIGGLVGTPAYMAPEQVEGKQDIDPRADLYALGAILFELLTGAPPWTGDAPVAVAVARLLNPPPELDADRTPPALRELVARCLARHREDRFATTRGLITDLEHLRATLTSSSQQMCPSPARAAAPTEGGEPTLLLDTSDKTTVALLPIRNRTRDEDDYLADGLTEEIAGELSMLADLKIKPPSAAAALGEELAPIEIGRRLGVQVIIEGSLRTLGEMLRIRVALISVEEGFQIWGEKFTGAAADLFDIAEEAAQAIGTALTTTSDEAKEAMRRPDALSDPTAVDLYMRARHSLSTNWYIHGVEEAIDLFEQARARAPKDPRVLTGLATAYARQTFFEPERAHELLESARELAERAVHIAPDWADPQFALAMVAYNSREFGACVRYSKAALKRSHDFLSAHELLGRVQAEIGPLDRARHHLERTLELDEHMYGVRWDLTRVYALLKEWERVEVLLEMPVPEDYLGPAYAMKMRYGSWYGDYSWADDIPETFDADSNFDTLFQSGKRLARAHAEGRPLEASYVERMLTSADDDTPGSQRQLLWLQITAELAMHAQDPELCVEILTRAVDVGLRDLMWLEHGVIFDPIRDHDGFQKILARMRRRTASWV